MVTSSDLLTSSMIASALPPFLVIPATTSSSASFRRPETTTVQPSAANATAPASPIPLPPPVTQDTRFPLFVMQTVSFVLLGAFLLFNPLNCAARGPQPPIGMMHQCAPENHHERQPVFPPVRRPRRSGAACDRNARRPT